jgi:hypothetical protein
MHAWADNRLRFDCGGDSSTAIRESLSRTRILWEMRFEKGRIKRGLCGKAASARSMANIPQISLGSQDNRALSENSEMNESISGLFEALDCFCRSNW